MEDAFQVIAEATRSFGDPDSGHDLHVHSAPSFASLWLMPNLEAFSSRYPNQRISVHAAPLVQPFENPMHDMAITYGAPPDPGLVVHPLASEVVQPLCSPDLISKGTPLSAPEDLLNHVLIHSRTRTSWGTWLKERGIREDGIRRHLQVDLSAMAIDSAVRGLGVILESDLLAAEELRQGRLVAPFAVAVAAEPAYFLAYRSEDAHASHIVTFAQWLLGEFDRTGESHERPEMQ